MHKLIKASWMRFLLLCIVDLSRSKFMPEVFVLLRILILSEIQIPLCFRSKFIRPVHRQLKRTRTEEEIQEFIL